MNAGDIQTQDATNIQNTGWENMHRPRHLDKQAMLVQ